MSLMLMRAVCLNCGQSAHSLAPAASMSSGTGFVLAAMSAVLNGSFVVFSKLPSVKRAGVDPLVFQLWTSVGVFLSSLLTMPFFDGDKYPPGAIGWGVLAGGLFVCAVAFSFVAVQLVGLSIAQGIWSGSAVLVSFVWGVAAFGDEVTPGIAGAGLTLIVVGVLGIALCADIAAACFGQPKDGGDPNSASAPLVGGHGRLDSSTGSLNGHGGLGSSDPKLLQASLLEDGAITPAHRARANGGSMDLDPRLVHPAAQSPSNHGPGRLPSPPLLADPLTTGRIAGTLGIDASQSSANGSEWSRHHSSASFDSATSSGSSRRLRGAASVAAQKKLTTQRQLYGSVCALLVGVFGGSILMPLQLAPKEYRGLNFVPSLGLGTLIIAPMITMPYMYLSRSSPSRGHWAMRESLLPGLMAGAVWNGANVCSIYAISDVGYAVAYPLMQAAIAVAALWGIAVFKEIKGKQIGVVAVSAIVVLGGAVLLALSKKSS